MARQVTLPWVCTDCGKSYHTRLGLDQHRSLNGPDPQPRVFGAGSPVDPVPRSRPSPTGWVRYGENRWLKLDADGRPWIAWVP